MTFNDLSISESAIETTGVQSQPDTLTGTAAENKLVFDALPQLIVARFNMLITQLQAQAAAEQLGVTPFTGMTATNLQDALEALQTNLTQAIAGVGTGLAGSSGAASVGFNSTEQITAATVQAAIEAVQLHLDAFKTQLTGSGGAASVGTAPISGLDATNVQAALAELRDDIQNIVSGIIPGGTITTNMLADGSVTAAKLNVTGEDIPTSTTDATSLSSQLSNAIRKYVEIPSGTDLNSVVESGIYRLNGISSGFTNGPPSNNHGWGLMFVGGYQSDTVFQMMHVLGGDVWKRMLQSGSFWSEWTKLSDTTPPQEYNLPLAEGISTYGKSTYWKTYNGICFINFALNSTQPITNESVIATLPVGFRPSVTVFAGSHGYLEANTGARVAIDVELRINGSIVIWTEDPLSNIFGFIGFIADS